MFIIQITSPSNVNLDPKHVIGIGTIPDGNDNSSTIRDNSLRSHHVPGTGLTSFCIYYWHPHNNSAKWSLLSLFCRAESRGFHRIGKLQKNNSSNLGPRSDLTAHALSCARS